MRARLSLYIILLMLISTLVFSAQDTKTIRLGLISENAATSLDLPNGPNLANIGINSNPEGAEVWIDGNYSGHLTPSKFMFKKAENHSFELHLVGYESQMINLTTSNSMDVNVDLSTGPGFNTSRLPSIVPYVIVDIKSNPSGAEVWKDHENTGKLTPFSENAAVYEKHTYEVRMKGHEDSEILVYTDHNLQWNPELK